MRVVAVQLPFLCLYTMKNTQYVDYEVINLCLHKVHVTFHNTSIETAFASCMAMNSSSASRVNFPNRKPAP